MGPALSFRPEAPSTGRASPRVGPIISRCWSARLAGSLARLSKFDYRRRGNRFYESCVQISVPVPSSENGVTNSMSRSKINVALSTFRRRGPVGVAMESLELHDGH